MKHVTFLTALALVGLVGCTNPAFTGTEFDASTKSTNATNANAPHSNSAALAIISQTGAVSAGTAANAAEQIRLVFAGGSVDATTLASAVTFWNLTATPAADGAWARGAALTPTNASAPSVTYNASSDQTTVVYTLDLSAANTVSSVIEVFVDPTKLTADGGTRKLNLDGDLVQGEAGDDDYVGYVTVTGGTLATVPAGGAKAPRTPLSSYLTVGNLPAAGGTQVTITYTQAGVDNTDYKALFDAGLVLQKFDASAGTWSNVAVNTTYNTGTGAYVVTLPATAGRDVYRWKSVYSSSLVSGKTVAGYSWKGSFYDGETFSYGGDLPIAEPTPTYNVTNMVASTGGVTATATSDTTLHNVVVTLVFSDVGALGLSGVSTTTLKLLNTTTGRYAPVASIVALPPVAGNTTYVVTLSPTYLKTGGALQAQFSPKVIDLGDTTASSDDVSYGNWQNTAPGLYGWRLKTLGALL